MKHTKFFPLFIFLLLSVTTLHAKDNSRREVLERAGLLNIIWENKSSARNCFSPQQYKVNYTGKIRADDKRHHEFIVRILQQTRRYVTDVNRDGEINCIDYSITFYRLAERDGTYHPMHFDIVVNYNPYTGMNHMFIKFRVDGETYYIEPQSQGDYDKYLMEAKWGDEYNPVYNIEDKTYYYLRLYDKTPANQNQYRY